MSKMKTKRALAWLAVLGLGIAGPAAATDMTFIAVLNGAQEVPPTTSTAVGNALLRYDRSSDLLCFSISNTALAGPELFSHFHGPAEPEANAGVVFTISPGPSPVGAPKSGCVGPLSSTQERELRRGLWYINIHSLANPTGEIRGQVIPVRQPR